MTIPFQRMAFMRPEPELVTLDLDKVTKFQKKTRKQRDDAEKGDQALRDKKLTADQHEKKLLAEYEQLAKQLSDLKQSVQHYMIRIDNHLEGAVKLLQDLLDKNIAEQKQALEKGNVLRKRTITHTIKRLTGELQDAKDELTKALHWKANAEQALATFDGHERLKELKQLLSL